MKILLPFVFILVFRLNAFATGQIPDKIIYNGKEYSLLSNPLEPYFEKNPEKRPRSEFESTALWRGYVAIFEIRNNELFLKDIEVEYEGNAGGGYRSVLREVFPGVKDIKIDWLTGMLVLPYGKIVEYVHMGYGSTYENYILLEVDKGNLKREKHFKSREYQKFKERQFQAFRQTEEYRKIKAELIKQGSSDEHIDSFLRDFVTEYTSKILED